jgi:hypothetical protein
VDWRGAWCLLLHPPQTNHTTQPPTHAPTHPSIHATHPNRQVRVGSSRDGVHVSALREIRALRELGRGGCANVVSLLDVFPNKAGTSLCLVFEFLDW